MKRIYLLCAAVGAAIGSASSFAETCPLAQTGERMHVATETPTIAETAMANKDFSTLVAAVKAAGWADELMGKGPLTVFAPTNEAFAKLPKGAVEELLKPENREKLISILTYHVLPGAVESDAAMKLDGAETVQGAKLPLKVVDGKLMVGDAWVVKADIPCANGVIHVIDAVLMPPADMSAEMPATIADAAMASKDFTTLVAALKAAGWADKLMGEGPFTVFAPTNEAFAKLPEGAVAGLLKPEAKDKLTAVLTYHVVPGKVLAADVAKMKSAKTVQGGELWIDAGPDGLMINGAKVIAADVECGNGVIHVIDSVLMPK